VSNHAKPGQESRHNLIYWRSGDWLGIGPGAHGRLTSEGQRWATDTPLSPTAWLTAVEKTGSGENTREFLSPRERLSEALMMGLRISEGVDLSAYCLPETFTQKTDDLSDISLVTFQDKRLKTTAAGRPVINAILRDLFETLP
jgi:oxygen-independent coproporphyrinogen-3 oxidase